MIEEAARTVVLTIAGSDSGGGAGIQADLKTFHAFGVFGTSAVTAITVQNTLGVSAVHAVPLDIVTAQIDAVASDLRPTAYKTGMLATRELVEAVAASIRRHAPGSYVLDPVMVATSGDRLLEKSAEGAILTHLGSASFSNALAKATAPGKSSSSNRPGRNSCMETLSAGSKPVNGFGFL
jgi:hydroxymethylpyrimidine/phosphomethylpyrimidine kinase